MADIEKGKILILSDDGGDELKGLIGEAEATVLTFTELRATALHASNVEVFSRVIFLLFKDPMTHLNVELLMQIFAVMKPGGVLNMRCMEKGENVLGLFQLFEKYSVYGGFVDSKMIQTNDNIAQFTCTRPTWSPTSVARIGGGGEVELIDEDSLLNINEKPYVPLAKGTEGCDMKPRACANCNCGRAELEVEVGAEEAKKRLQQGTVRSNCGSCYKGDAFRCAGCPYSGLPAFKPGSKIELALDQQNIIGQLENSDAVKVSTTGKMTVEL